MCTDVGGDAGGGEGRGARVRAVPRRGDEHAVRQRLRHPRARAHTRADGTHAAVLSSSVSAASTDSPARNTLRNLNVHPHPRKSSCCLSGWATPGHRGGRTSRRWRSGCTCTAGIRAGASVTPLASSPCGARANPGLEPKAVYGSACGRPLSWSTRWTRIARCDRRSWKAGRLTGHRTTSSGLFGGSGEDTVDGGRYSREYEEGLRGGDTSGEGDGVDPTPRLRMTLAPDVELVAEVQATTCANGAPVVRRRCYRARDLRVCRTFVPITSPSSKRALWAEPRVDFDEFHTTAPTRAE